MSWPRRFTIAGWSPTETIRASRLFWNIDIGGDLWKPSSLDLNTPLEVRLMGNPARSEHRAHEFLCREEAKPLAQAQGPILDEES
jgi:hypothetical protein